MTYNVFGGTFNLALSIYLTYAYWFYLMGQLMWNMGLLVEFFWQTMWTY